MSNAVNLRVLLTRPTAQNQLLLQELQQMRWQTESLPLFEIKPLLNKALLQQTVATLPNFDLVILVSRNAAELFLPLLPLEICRKLTWGCIGPASAKFLQNLQVPSWICAAQPPFNSTALLHELQHQAFKLEGARVLVLTGVGGDQDLSRLLHENGARPQICAVYERCKPNFNTAQLQLFLELNTKTDIMVITCVTSLLHLKEFGTTYQLSLDNLPLLVISPRIAAAALEMGFINVYTSRGVSEADIISGLIDWQQRQHDDRK
jgi:uroporphyrinogen-III synthase